MDDWIFGCDICQDVCPWNRFSLENTIEQFQPNDSILNFTKKDWEDISEDVFKNVFQKSAVKRTKYEGLKRNISFVQ